MACLSTSNFGSEEAFLASTGSRETGSSTRYPQVPQKGGVLVGMQSGALVNKSLALLRRRIAAGISYARACSDGVSPCTSPHCPSMLLLSA